MTRGRRPVAAVALAAAAATVTWIAGPPTATASAPPPAAPEARAHAPAVAHEAARGDRRAQRGAVTLGASLEGAPFDRSVAVRYGRMVGRRPRILMWYRQWNVPLFDGLEAREVRRTGTTPVVTWEPWDPTARDATRDPAFALARIVRGEFDGYIARSARAARRQRAPLLINFAPEMNGDWAPWGRSINGNRPADYVRAYRRVVRIFRREGATNVGWVWTPNGFHDTRRYAPYFPGAAWVDWLGLDAYNWGSSRPDGWTSPVALFTRPYRAVVALADKPVLILETASAEAGGDKAAWIRALARELPRRFPRVRALVWFQRLKENDWRVDSSPQALRAFRRLAASARFAGGPLPARPRARAGRRTP